MRLARFVLAASALPFAASGLAFLSTPLAMSARVGIALGDSTADSDARAVYGGLQLACAALLAGAARGSAPWVRAGLVAQLFFYGGLASARGVSLVLAGAPSALGSALHAVELAGLAAGALAWRGLAKPGARTFAAPAGRTIGRAVPNDLGALLPLVEAFQREAGYATGDAALRDTLARLLREESAGRVLIAREGARAVGYAALCFGYSIEFRGRDAFVDELYVVPEARGGGLGRALLRALEAEARASGVHQLHLEVEQHNAAARRLYLAESFAANGRELLGKRLG
jgi:ribosomal protein S18 acetylase RimI-like enzyme